MSKQSDAFEDYARVDPDVSAPEQQAWTAGYLGAARPLCALLERLQYAFVGTDGLESCPLCLHARGEGHAVDCEIDAWLSEERARRVGRAP